MICKAFLLVMNDVSQYKIILVINIVSHNFVDVPQQYHSYIQRKIKFLFVLSHLHFHFRVSTSPFYHSIIRKSFSFQGESRRLFCVAYEDEDESSTSSPPTAGPGMADGPGYMFTARELILACLLSLTVGLAVGKGLKLTHSFSFAI